MPIYKGDIPIVEASGRKGKDGIDGENGATYTPSISEEGILSWTNDKNLPNPEPINVKGQDGVSYTLTKSEDGTKIILTGSDGSIQEIIDSNTTYSVATQNASGLMSKEDKIKLDGISEGGGVAFGEATTLYNGKVAYNSTLQKYVITLTKSIKDFDVIYITITPYYYKNGEYGAIYPSPFVYYPKVTGLPTSIKIGFQFTTSNGIYYQTLISNGLTINFDGATIAFDKNSMITYSTITVHGFNLVSA